MATSNASNAGGQQRLTVWGRVQSAVQAFRAPAGGHFAPLEPIVPTQAAELEPRRYQYRVGANIVARPRAEEGLTPFDQLRWLADNYDVLRIAIGVKKQEIAALDWEIVPRVEGRGDPKLTEKAKVCSGWFESPDKEQDWSGWVQAALEEMMVTDALTIYPRRNRAGELYSLELIDGSGIKPLIDFRGRRPLPPAPAYQQVLYGVPWSEFYAYLGFKEGPDGLSIIKDLPLWDLMYLPVDRRVNSMYGRSPTEWIIVSVNTALRRQFFDLEYYRTGNVPEGYLALPDNWTPDQIREFQEWWDDLTTGPEGSRRRVMFGPGGTGQRFTQFKQPGWDTPMMQWLLQITCAAVGTTPSEIGFTENTNRSTAQGQENVQFRRGLGPFLRHVKRTVDTVLKNDLNAGDLQFRWVGLEPEEDKLKQAQVDKIYVESGIDSIDEARVRRGQSPLGIPHFVLTRQGLTFLKDLVPGATENEEEEVSTGEEQLSGGVVFAPPDTKDGDLGAQTAVAASTKSGGDAGANAGPEEPVQRTKDEVDVNKVQKELHDWERWALRRRREGLTIRPFSTAAVPGELAAAVNGLLKAAESDLEVRAVFERANGRVVEKYNDSHDERGRFASGGGGGGSTSSGGSTAEGEQGAEKLSTLMRSTLSQMARNRDEDQAYAAQVFQSAEEAVNAYTAEHGGNKYQIMERAAMTVENWGRGSAGREPSNVATMLVAQQAFSGKQDPDAANMAHIPADVMAKGKADVTFGPETRLAAFNALYDHTQSILKREGVSEVTVHRIVSFPPDKVPEALRGLEVGKSMGSKSTLAPLSSFSTDKKALENYRGVFDKQDRAVFTITGTVRAEHVVGIGGHGLGTPDIREVVVRDHPFVGSFTRDR